jgi:hypothetical protein
VILAKVKGVEKFGQDNQVRPVYGAYFIHQTARLGNVDRWFVSAIHLYASNPHGILRFMSWPWDWPMMTPKSKSIPLFGVMLWAIVLEGCPSAQKLFLYRE